MERGKRYAVCDRTYRDYKSGPFADAFEFIEPRIEVPMAKAKEFDCSITSYRPVAVTKGTGYDATTEASNCCEPGGGGC